MPNQTEPTRNDIMEVFSSPLLDDLGVCDSRVSHVRMNTALSIPVWTLKKVNSQYPSSNACQAHRSQICITVESRPETFGGPEENLTLKASCIHSSYGLVYIRQCNEVIYDHRGPLARVKDEASGILPPPPPMSVPIKIHNLLLRLRPQLFRNTRTIHPQTLCCSCNPKNKHISKQSVGYWLHDLAIH